MNDTIKIYKDFLENIEYTLQVEKNKFKGEVNNKFEELIDPELSKIEFISENAEKNISVIDAMRGAYNDSTKADNIRSNMIKEINDLRNTTKVIMNEILSQISDIYQSNLNSDYFLEIANDIKTKYTTINNQQLEIIKELREYNKHDEKFDIYFDDIKI
jgi:cellulose biosynthesis protein BcsQ